MTLRAQSFEAPGLEADVALAAGGDAAAFERLYRTHVAKVHSLARRMRFWDSCTLAAPRGRT